MPNGLKLVITIAAGLILGVGIAGQSGWVWLFLILGFLLGLVWASAPHTNLDSLLKGGVPGALVGGIAGQMAFGSVGTVVGALVCAIIGGMLTWER